MIIKKKYVSSLFSHSTECVELLQHVNIITERWKDDYKNQPDDYAIFCLYTTSPFWGGGLCLLCLKY